MDMDMEMDMEMERRVKRKERLEWGVVSSQMEEDMRGEEEQGEEVTVETVWVSLTEDTEGGEEGEYLPCLDLIGLTKTVIALIWYKILDIRD